MIPCKKRTSVKGPWGAVLPENHHFIRLITQTIHEKRKEKEAIAKLAVSMIELGSTVMIDSGSTTSFIARYIKEMKLTVLTNSVLILQELAGSNTIELLAAQISSKLKPRIT